MYSGESIFKYTTGEKKKHYSNGPNIRGFKIDIRIIVDVGDEECDIGAAELAKQDNLKKVIDDEAKLSKEGKDVIDHLVKLPITNLCPMSWLIQIANCECRLSTIHLAGDGLYVTVPQFDQLALPKRFNEMDCIVSSLKTLTTMEHSLRKIADLLPAVYAKKEQLEEHLGRRPTLKPDYTGWLRGTFYTPPSTYAPRLPVDLFSRRPSDMKFKLLKTKHLDALPHEFANTSNVPDKFGWIYLPHLKKHYNIITKSYSAHHPFSHCQAPTRSTSSSISSSASASASSSKQR